MRPDGMETVLTRLRVHFVLPVFPAQLVHKVRVLRTGRTGKAAFVKPAIGDHLFHRPDRHAARLRPRDPVEKVADAQRGVERSDQIEHTGTDHRDARHIARADGGGIDRAAVERQPFLLRTESQLLSQCNGAMRVIHQHHALQLKTTGRHQVVGIQQGNGFAARRRDAAIARRRNPRIGLRHQRHARAERADALGGVVR